MARNLRAICFITFDDGLFSDLLVFDAVWFQRIGT